MHLLSATLSDTAWWLILKAALQTLPRLQTESEGKTTLNFINMKHKEQHFDIYSLSMKVIMESPNCAKCSKLLNYSLKKLILNSNVSGSIKFILWLKLI